MQAKAMSPQPGRFVVGCGGIFFWPKEKGEAAPGGFPYRRTEGKAPGPDIDCK